MLVVAMVAPCSKCSATLVPLTFDGHDHVGSPFQKMGERHRCNYLVVGWKRIVGRCRMISYHSF